MTFIDVFFIGIGLSLDACCVCTSNGLVYRPTAKEAIQYSLVFAVFQGVMPLFGYVGIGVFDIKLFEYNHFIALILLSVVGGKMIYESFEQEKEDCCKGHQEITITKRITGSILFMQGLSTSIDALSVGLTFYNYTMEFVLYAVSLIAVITWVMCFVALRVGIQIGTKLNAKAELVGGLVLVLLGMKIFLIG